MSFSGEIKKELAEQAQAGIAGLRSFPPLSVLREISA